MFRIHSLTLKNIRGVQHLSLDNVPETGVTIIHGDNEAGKSTILEALQFLLSTKYKHGSSAAAIKALQPVGSDVAPEAQARLTIGPYELTILKRWVKTKAAELTIHSPHPENLTGDDAEDRLAEIINQHLDTNLLDQLFLAQDDLGNSFAAAGLPTFATALSQSHGPDEAIDTSEDDALIASVEREYARFFNKQGKPAKELQRAIKDAEAAGEHYQERADAYRRLQENVLEVEKLEKVLELAKKDLPQAELRLAQARGALAEAEKAQEAYDKAVVAAKTAERDKEAAEAAVAARDELQQELDDVRAHVEKNTPLLEQAQKKVEADALKLEELTEAWKKAQEELTSARDHLREVETKQSRAGARRRFIELTHIVKKLDALDAEISTLHEKDLGKPIDDSALSALEEAQSDLEYARRIRDTFSPHFTLSGPDSAGLSVDGEGRTISDTPRIDVVEGTEITIDEVTLTYHAGGQRGEDPSAQVEEKQLRFEELLASYEVKDLEEARARRQFQREHRSEIERLKDSRENLLAGQDIEQIRAEYRLLEAQVTGDDENLESKDDLDQLLEHARKRRDEAEDAVEQAAAAREPWLEASSERELIRLSTENDQAQLRVTELEGKFAAAEENAPLSELNTVLAQAKEASTESQTAVDAAAEVLKHADPQHQREEYESAEAATQAVADRISETQNSLLRYAGYIDQAEGAADAMRQADDERQRTSQVLDSLQRQADATKLLRDVLKKHQTLARERYAQPFVDELSQLASGIFGPEVSFTLDSNLQVTGRTIDNKTVNIEHLSGGAREQLAIMSRFAVASLIARQSDEPGAGVPLIVDDALGSSDVNRLHSMGALFRRLGKHSQVIVLTCMPQRYDSITGATRYSMDALKA